MHKALKLEIVIQISTLRFSQARIALFIEYMHSQY